MTESFRETRTESLAPDRRRSTAVVALRQVASGAVFELDQRRRWVVGASPSCDLTLDDPFVSQRHCLLERKPGGSVIVRDNQSRNGTFLDGNPVEAAELRVGAYLTLGRTTLVALGATSADARPCALEMLRGRDPALRATIEQALR